MNNIFDTNKLVLTGIPMSEENDKGSFVQVFDYCCVCCDYKRIYNHSVKCKSRICFYCLQSMYNTALEQRPDDERISYEYDEYYEDEEYLPNTIALWKIHHGIEPLNHIVVSKLLCPCCRGKMFYDLPDFEDICAYWLYKNGKVILVNRGDGLAGNIYGCYEYTCFKREPYIEFGLELEIEGTDYRFKYESDKTSVTIFSDARVIVYDKNRKPPRPNGFRPIRNKLKDTADRVTEAYENNMLRYDLFCIAFQLELLHRNIIQNLYKKVHH